MSTATLRRLGGSTVVAIPPAMLDLLKCRAGDSVDFSFSDDRIEIRLAKKVKMSLKDRLAMYQQAKELKTDEEKRDDDLWLNSPSVGKEL